MLNDLNLKILNSYKQVDKINNYVKNKMINFVIKANELVQLSEDDYQIERSLLLNKISLKGYILESPLCEKLKDNNVSNYSIEDLKQYLVQYENNYNEDCTKYSSAISLYELAEEIERLIEDKIDLERKILMDIIPDIDNLKDIDKSKYKDIYLRFKQTLFDKISDLKINEDVYNICINILNDIFNFYINGYPYISDEYIYKIED